MKVSKKWLQELVDLKVSDQELTDLLPLRTIAITENTPEFFELDMKGYNRADLLSMRGVAYEVAAVTDSQIKFTEPDPTKFIWVDQSLPKVEIHASINSELAPVYTLAKIEGLKVEPSPAEWVKKLEDSGMRSINNVADITNLIMLEFGQPLHAFDGKVEPIDVRNTLVPGEHFLTLDNKTRGLEADDIVIYSGKLKKTVGLAGVMGGKESEVSDDTTSIILEAAIFNTEQIRKTANRLGLQSEASKRFYHGLTRKRLLQALDAAIRMYQELGGKLTAVSLIGEDLQDQAKKVPLTLKKTQSLIGVEISAEKTEEYLKKLNFDVSSRVANAPSNNIYSSSSEAQPSKQSLPLPSKGREVAWVVTPPYWRLDVEIEEDLIEEIARMYGYENIPAKPLEGELPAKIDQSLFELIYDLKTKLVDQGFTELQTYSYFSTNVLKNFDVQTSDLIKIANPISAETEYMRNNLWFNLVEKAGENLKYFDQVAIFELGKTYDIKDGPPSPNGSGGASKIREEYRLALLLVDGTDNPLANLNSILEKVAKSVTHPENQTPKKFDFFHPNRHAPLLIDDQPIGGMAEVHPRTTNRFGIEKRVAIAEIKIEKLL